VVDGEGENQTARISCVHIIQCDNGLKLKWPQHLNVRSTVIINNQENMVHRLEPSRAIIFLSYCILCIKNALRLGHKSAFQCTRNANDLKFRHGGDHVET
jgi:hypothetical protein